MMGVSKHNRDNAASLALSQKPLIIDSGAHEKNSSPIKTKNDFATSAVRTHASFDSTVQL